MKDFSRQPTQAERLLGVVLTATLSILFGSLAIFLVSRSMWVAAVTCAVLFAAAIVMLCRAAFGKSRALNQKSTHALAWILLFIGLAGFALVLFIPGSRVHRLMVLGGSITFFSTGLAGVQRRGHDA